MQDPLFSIQKALPRVSTLYYVLALFICRVNTSLCVEAKKKFIKAFVGLGSLRRRHITATPFPFIRSAKWIRFFRRYYTRLPGDIPGNMWTDSFFFFSQHVDYQQNTENSFSTDKSKKKIQRICIALKLENLFLKEINNLIVISGECEVMPSAIQIRDGKLCK